MRDCNKCRALTSSAGVVFGLCTNHCMSILVINCVGILQSSVAWESNAASARTPPASCLRALLSNDRMPPVICQCGRVHCATISQQWLTLVFKRCQLYEESAWTMNGNSQIKKRPTDDAVLRQTLNPVGHPARPGMKYETAFTPSRCRSIQTVAPSARRTNNLPDAERCRLDRKYSRTYTRFGATSSPCSRNAFRL